MPYVTEADVEPLTVAAIEVGIKMAVSVKVWLPVPSVLFAVMHTVYVPADPGGGVPDKRPVLERVMPDGRVDGVQAPFPYAASVYVGAGKPVVVTWKLPRLLIVNVELLALFM